MNVIGDCACVYFINLLGIHNNKKSKHDISLLFRFVSIEKCRHTTIVLGAVETTIHISGCEHIRVVALARRCSIRYDKHSLPRPSVMIFAK